MKTVSTVMLLTGLAALTAGCAARSIDDRRRPDEFAVGRSAPLVIPPDFALEPPRPGAPRPLPADSQIQALEALFGPGVRPPPPSALERHLLERAGADQRDPAIRSTVGELVGEGATQGVDKGAFLRELLDAPGGSRTPDVAQVSVPR